MGTGTMFERTENEQEIIIVQKPYFYYLFTSAFVSAILVNIVPQLGWLNTFSVACWFALLIYMAVNFKMIISTRQEVSAAMKEGRVFVRGSKFSATHPFTYRILKNN